MQLLRISYRALISELDIICLTKHQAFLSLLGSCRTTKYLDNKIDNIYCLQKSTLYFTNISLISKKSLILSSVNLPLILSICLKYTAKSHNLRLLVIDTIHIYTVSILKASLLIQNVEYLVYFFVGCTLLHINSQAFTVLITSICYIYYCRQLTLANQISYSIQELFCGTYHGRWYFCNANGPSSSTCISYFHLTTNP